MTNGPPPLPQDVGKALVAYLEDGRPKGSTSRQIFLRCLPPFQPLATSNAIVRVAQQALQRAGVAKQPRVVSHVFRHTAASQMLNQGASFKEVADVLGHRSLQNTGINPLKVLKSHDLRPANNLAVDTCGVFGSLILFGAGFLGPRGCFWNLESFTLLASI